MPRIHTRGPTSEECCHHHHPHTWRMKANAFFARHATAFVMSVTWVNVSIMSNVSCVCNTSCFFARHEPAFRSASNVSKHKHSLFVRLATAF